MVWYVLFTMRQKIEHDTGFFAILLYAMKHRSAKRGIATLCLGGGNGVALAVERP